MPLSSARGHPDFQTARITDLSSFPLGQADPAYHRLVNGYAGMSSKAILTDDEEKQVAIFEMEKMEYLGQGAANPKLWARLKRLGPVAYIQSLIDKMK